MAIPQPLPNKMCLYIIKHTMNLFCEPGGRDCTNITIHHHNAFEKQIVFDYPSQKDEQDELDPWTAHAPAHSNASNQARHAYAAHAFEEARSSRRS